MLDELTAAVKKSRLFRRTWAPSLVKREVALVFSRNNAKEALRWFQDKYGKEPSAVVTNGKTESGKSYVSFDLNNLKIDKSKFDFIIFGKNNRSLSISLALGGVRDLFFSSDPNYRHIKDNPNYLTHYKAELKTLFETLEDEESRLTLASVLKHRTTGDHGYLRIARYPEYEHPCVSAQAGEWVADCGASNGATSFRFAKRVGSRGVVYAFEPDPQNIAKIKLAIPAQPKGAGKVIVIHAAVSNSPGSLSFRSGKGGSSHLTAAGDISVDVRTIDDVANEYNIQNAGLVSLDVEGFEKRALEGGMNTIKKLRPKLQVSIYHKSDDLFSLPLWLKGELTGYKFYMGHHDSYHCETDLYCVPSERPNSGKALATSADVTTLPLRTAATDKLQRK
jgi:FkbM family methyltransferase